MDQSKALQRLTEAADLTAMVEELLKGAQNDKALNTGMPGIRLTLKSIREAILASHDVFAGEMVARSRGRAESTVLPVSASSDSQATTKMLTAPTTEPSSSATEPTVMDPTRLGLRRRDLRAAIERL